MDPLTKMDVFWVVCLSVVICSIIMYKLESYLQYSSFIIILFHLFIQRYFLFHFMLLFCFYFFKKYKFYCSIDFLDLLRNLFLLVRYHVIH